MSATKCRSEYVLCPAHDRRCTQDADHVTTSPLHINRAGFAWSDDETALAVLDLRREVAEEIARAVEALCPEPGGIHAGGHCDFAAAAAVAREHAEGER